MISKSFFYYCISKLSIRHLWAWRADSNFSNYVQVSRRLFQCTQCSIFANCSSISASESESDFGLQSSLISASYQCNYFSSSPIFKFDLSSLFCNEHNYNLLLCKSSSASWHLTLNALFSPYCPSNFLIKNSIYVINYLQIFSQDPISAYVYVSSSTKLPSCSPLLARLSRYPFYNPVSISAIFSRKSSMSK